MKIRINQDVTFNWKLTVEGESVDLSKLELSVEITTPSNKKTEITPNIQFDTLEFNYRPKQVGEYILSAYLNRFKDGETALDIKAFEGVKYTWNQDFSIDDNLEANYVELAGDFNFGHNAPDVPSVDLSDYAKTTYVDTQINNEATARTQADSELQTHINDEVNARTQADTELQNNINNEVNARTQADEELQTHINNEVNARTQADTELQNHINEKQDSLIAGDNIKIENNVISAIGGGTTDVTKLSVKITWAELKALVDNSKLVVGQQYRITDYTCTTTDVATKSAGNVFDIIVTADDESTLNEVARAVKHDGDEYFANSDLSAWKIWYCIDNDTNRFAWADTENGKGVIYRMIDDLNNDVPYDFKNIQFYRQWDEDKQLWSVISSNNTGVPCYTFSSEGDSSTVEFTDMSLSISNNVYSNVIKEYISIGKQTLNNICLFGHNCYRNSFGSYCYFNSFGTGCDTNTFGCRCNTNSFGYGCAFNTFGDKFECNSLGNYCLHNSFGNDCSYNSLDDTCFGNSFGNSCVYNSIGESCSYNSFGNGCNCIKFASDSSETSKYGYYQNNHFGDGCEYIVFTGAENVTNASEIHNYNFAQGLQGTADNYLIVEGKRNRAYDTYISKGTIGTIKESVIAEKQDKLIAGENIKIENNVISAIVGGNTDATELLVKIHWAELKVLISNSQLVAGQQYRITDYTCTTTQAATKSAGHVFDIIVTADSESVLNEEARAIQHEDDTYFANSNLSAWKIWYCIDNDTNRFAWADSTNGKGVIYRMIDEFNNDVPYDFKNIQFYRQWDSSKSLWSTIPDGNTGVPCYTFSSIGDSSTAEFTDMSLSASNNVYSNVIKEYIKSKKQTLNNNCFFGSYCYENTLASGCYENTFGSYCSNNSFGDGCYSNSLGAGCHSNSFGHGCDSISFGIGCAVNTFGSYCSKNTFEDDCDYNSFGNGFYANSFGRGCRYNSFGNGCSHNSFGNSCSHNSFGNSCHYIKFATDSSATTKYAYYQNNHFGDYCEYIILKGAETASAESSVQNYNFAQGLKGTANAYISIDGKRGRKYETKVANNSSGTLKIYCEADLSR